MESGGKLLEDFFVFKINQFMLDPVVKQSLFRSLCHYGDGFSLLSNKKFMLSLSTGMCKSFSL